MSPRFARRHVLAMIVLVVAHAASTRLAGATAPMVRASPTKATDRAAAAASGSPLTPGTDVDPPPGHSDAEIVLEPAILALGGTAIADVVLSTPPGYAMRLVDPVPELPGVWTLESRLLPVERGADRWIHRLRIRVRAREVGAFDWPGLRLAVDGPDGTREALDVAGRRIEIASSLALRAPSEGPFGLRAPGLPNAGTDPWVPALVGSLATLALLGLVALVRRERRKRSASQRVDLAGDARTPAQPAARALLETARECADADPVAAAALVARAARRLLADLTHEIPVAMATEELARRNAPYVVRSRWPRWLALLADLDRLRFERAPREAHARTRAALLEAGALIDDTEPTRQKAHASRATVTPSGAEAPSEVRATAAASPRDHQRDPRDRSMSDGERAGAQAIAVRGTRDTPAEVPTPRDPETP